MEQGDVLDTEEAVAAEFALGGPAASYRNQWLCVKAAFTQKDGIVFLGTALGAKSVVANVTKFRHKVAFFFFAFLHYIHHTRPDPITKRISAVPPSKWRDGSYICLPIYLLKFSA